MIKIKLNQLQEKEVTALRCQIDFLGNRFRVFVYYIDEFLIETGPARIRKQVETFVKEWELKGAAVTHFHEDHAGNAAYLAKRYHLPVYMGEKTAKVMTSPPQIPFYRRVVLGSLEPVLGEPRKKIETKHFCFQAVPTPGHTEDHITWVEEEQGWAFTGDLYLGTRLTYGFRDESISKLIDSIRKLQRYPIKTVFCSHAGIISEGPKALKQKQDFLEWLCEETLHLHDQGAPTQEIVRRLLKKRPGLVLISNGELAPIHLIRIIIKENQREC
ncbi:MBL fold metallo-hydrolase [Melghirimyces algeriensis]|nr:MBL fold metallo-hydrolase [Melghirimyces algeriensis]